MPSFCAPLGLGPNAVMTRPFTGQRNFGSAINVSPGAITCTCWALLVAGAAIAGAGPCGVVEATRGEVEPVASYFGMTRCWPGLKAVPFGMLLASAMAEAGTP